MKLTGSVRINKSKMMKYKNVFDDEMFEAIQKYITRVDKNTYKISQSGLDLIISIKGKNITLDTVFSDKDKFYEMSKKLFQENQSMYAQFGITEKDIINKMNEIIENKIELNFKINKSGGKKMTSKKRNANKLRKTRKSN
jgi:cytochrome c556